MLLFIDTNVFLSFYEFTRDDLEELKKLSAMLQRDELTLVLPTQVTDEFWRNRDQRIAEAVRHVARLAKRREYQRMFQGLTEYERVRRLEEESEALHKSLIAKAESGARDRGFPADLLIKDLFGRARQIEVVPAYIERARTRRDLGQPPGKKGSLGDAVNWEALLDVAPKGEDLHFVTGDSDWVSPVSLLDFNWYLQHEWEANKGTRVVYYPLLSSFFEKNYPEIKIEADVGVELLIRDLAESGSFASTHTAIEELDRVVDFTPRQVSDICAAATSNGQVRRILGDPDVEAFIKKVLDTHSDDVEPDLLAYLRSLLKREEDLRAQREP